MTYPSYPMQYPINGENIAPVGLIPVELEIEGLYEDYDRRRKKNGNEKIVSSHVHSVGVQSTLMCQNCPTNATQRRRAQNRGTAPPFLISSKDLESTAWF